MSGYCRNTLKRNNFSPVPGDNVCVFVHNHKCVDMCAAANIQQSETVLCA